MSVDIRELWPVPGPQDINFKPLEKIDVEGIVREGVSIALGDPTMYDSSQIDCTNGARLSHLFKLSGERFGLISDRSGNKAGQIAPEELQDAALGVLRKEYGLDDEWFYQMGEQGDRSWFSQKTGFDIRLSEGEYKQITVFPSLRKGGLSFKRSMIYEKDPNGEITYKQVSWDALYWNTADINA